MSLEAGLIFQINPAFVIMMIEEYKKFLVEDIGCIIIKGEEFITLKKNGIRPLLEIVEKRNNLDGCVALDIIVGKAAALLYAKIGCCELYAEVLSIAGQKVLENYNIKYSYGKLVDFIVNRKGTGMCPMEAIVKNINNPGDAVKKIRNEINNTKISKGKI